MVYEPHLKIVAIEPGSQDSLKLSLNRIVLKESKKECKNALTDDSHG